MRKFETLKIFGAAGLILGLSVVGYFAFRETPIAAEQTSGDSFHSEPWLCDADSDEYLEALAKTFSGDANALNEFAELIGSCPHDRGVSQMLWSLEIAFPRAPSARSVSAWNLAASAEGQDANVLALALALLAFDSGVCGSTKLVIERMGLLGIRGERVFVAIRQADERRGGETLNCDPLGLRS